MSVAGSRSMRRVWIFVRAIYSGKGPPWCVSASYLLPHLFSSLPFTLTGVNLVSDMFGFFWGVGAIQTVR
ncbi:hypothetical protein C8R43DRAFT_974785 [Mycena crocata]|nr:hypothetical protein C8R43DRAFT_1053792 [Mycena crocata]KAJ7177473.1 hypothetical protein C8R43DRAFT_974785 [Mycena crocata]